MFGSKTAPRLPTGFIKNWYYYTIYSNTRIGGFCPHMLGTHNQNLCLVCVQFQFILRHPFRNVGEAVFQLCYPYVDYTLIDRFDRDVELCIIRISM